MTYIDVAPSSTIELVFTDSFLEVYFETLAQHGFEFRCWSQVANCLITSENYKDISKLRKKIFDELNISLYLVNAFTTMSDDVSASKEILSIAKNILHHRNIDLTSGAGASKAIQNYKMSASNLPLLTDHSGENYIYGLPYPLFLIATKYKGQVREYLCYTFITEMHSYKAAAPDYYFLQLTPATKNTGMLDSRHKTISNLKRFQRQAFFSKYKKVIKSVRKYLHTYYDYPQMLWHYQSGIFDYFPFTTSFHSNNLPDTASCVSFKGASLSHLRNIAPNKTSSLVNDLIIVLNSANKDATIPLFAATLFSSSKYFFNTYFDIKAQAPPKKTIRYLEKQVTINVIYSDSLQSSAVNLINAICNIFLFDFKNKDYLPLPFLPGSKKDSQSYSDTCFVIPLDCKLTTAVVETLIFDNPIYVLQNATVCIDKLIPIKLDNISDLDSVDFAKIIQSIIVNYTRKLSDYFSNEFNNLKTTTNEEIISICKVAYS